MHKLINKIFSTFSILILLLSCKENKTKYFLKSKDDKNTIYKVELLKKEIIITELNKKENIKKVNVYYKVGRDYVLRTSGRKPPLALASSSWLTKYLSSCLFRQLVLLYIVYSHLHKRYTRTNITFLKEKQSKHNRFFECKPGLKQTSFFQKSYPQNIERHILSLYSFIFDL
ncbi:hypothetical protein HZQ72_06195 [Elizabethkingia anophelis]|nr:hypothetical protein [Elizabethkingia anophelis]